MTAEPGFKPGAATVRPPHVEAAEGSADQLLVFRFPLIPLGKNRPILAALPAGLP